MESVLTIGALLAVIIIVLYFFLKAFTGKIEKNILDKIRDSFGTASIEALKSNSEEFLKLAESKLSKEAEAGTRELEAKKELIDQTLNQIKEEMDKIQQMMTSVDKNSGEKITAVAENLKMQGEATSKLSNIITDLNKTLSSSQARGRWGERMAEDILRLAGMEEGVSYIKQSEVGNSRNKPDFSFILPQGKMVNMDVKFPFDNYRAYCESDDEVSREQHKKQFLRDARNRVKEITTRDYINTDENTLDYVIIFIPLDQAYAFIMENDRDFMDFALKLKVIVCSPWTLYAYLAVIRQSIENFNMERSADKMKSHMVEFKKQWDSYCSVMDGLGKKIGSVQTEYDKLVTTRTNMLDRPLKKIEQMAMQRDPENEE